MRQEFSVACKETVHQSFKGKAEVNGLTGDESKLV